MAGLFAQQLQGRRRHAGLMQQLHGARAHGAALFGGLGEDTVAGCECRGHLAGENRQRKIPRADARDHAQRRRRATFEFIAHARRVVAQIVHRLPHFSDSKLGPRFTALCPAPYLSTVIDPRGEPLDVLRLIGSCRKIVTSSLHGMIVADAFGIPRRVEISPALAKDGGDFKFRDYSASVKMPLVAGKVAEPNRFHVEDLKFAVYDAFRLLGKELG